MLTAKVDSASGEREAVVPEPDAAAPSQFDDAFPALYGRAYHVAYQLLGCRSDAEDIAQEATARASVRWRKLGAGHPGAWVAVVATNLAIDVGRRHRLPLSSQPLATDSQEAATVERMALCAGLKALPDRQRTVVVLRYLLDLPEAEVARELGITVGTVKQHAVRGREHLRRWLNGP